mgnify:CR=1 FL=1
MSGNLMTANISHDCVGERNSELMRMLKWVSLCKSLWQCWCVILMAMCNERLLLFLRVQHELLCQSWCWFFCVWMPRHHWYLTMRDIFKLFFCHVFYFISFESVMFVLVRVDSSSCFMGWLWLCKKIFAVIFVYSCFVILQCIRLHCWLCSARLAVCSYA